MFFFCKQKTAYEMRISDWSSDVCSSDLDKYYATINATGLDHGELWSAGTELGRWLRSKPVLVKVGDTLFAHGGISPRVLATGLDIDAIDAVAARRIDLRRRETESPLATTLLQAPTALTKYRGLARASRGYQPATPAHMRNLLAHFGVRRITIGQDRKSTRLNSS